MAIQLVLAAGLRRYVPGYKGETGHLMRIQPGATIRDIARILSIREEEVKVIMVDGVSAEWETPLAGDERVALFPAVGAG